MERPLGWTGSAFGLSLAGFAVPGLERSPAAGLRRASLELASAAELRAAWGPGAETLAVRRYPGGRPAMLIDHLEGSGYRIAAPGYGRHLVSPDGSRVRSALPRASIRWQRLFVAQVLPLAATLQGLELLHGSAVAVDGRAFAFVAPSGTGKTSLAVHLVARGASLVADDALALELSGDGVLAHPGVGVVNVDEAELRALGGGIAERIGREVLRSDKVHLALTALAHEPMPLGGLFFLQRTRAGAVEIERLAAPDPLRLLGSRYITYDRSPRGLVNQLDLCAALAAAVPVFDVRMPPNVRASDLAAEVERHLQGPWNQTAG